MEGNLIKLHLHFSLKKKKKLVLSEFYKEQTNETINFLYTRRCTPYALHLQLNPKACPSSTKNPVGHITEQERKCCISSCFLKKELLP